MLITFKNQQANIHPVDTIYINCSPEIAAKLSKTKVDEFNTEILLGKEFTKKTGPKRRSKNTIFAKYQNWYFYLTDDTTNVNIKITSKFDSGETAPHTVDNIYNKSNIIYCNPDNLDKAIKNIIAEKKKNNIKLLKSTPQFEEFVKSKELFEKYPDTTGLFN